ncbi:MAG: molybdate ABC transporter substrate-binding protein [Pseudomonadaceae bacterium]|nr:molybdate ABC transporter substrate-binding protein [Pseudomonadaceae bacterium]
MRTWVVPVAFMLAGITIVSLLATQRPAPTEANADSSATAYVAVATNFRTTADQLTNAFMAQQQHQLIIVSGSTGKLFNQIKQGAPFDLFLSADAQRASRLIDEGFAVQGSQTTYALGRLALLGVQPSPLEDLKANQFRRLAVANARLAPYGLAAAQTLTKLGMQQVLADKIVTGENVGQAYAMVATGNADLGFVSLSMISPAQQAHTWIVPDDYHEPIRQDLVLLTQGQNNPAALAFLSFMSTSQARKLIEAAGYWSHSL